MGRICANLNSQFVSQVPDFGMPRFFEKMPDFGIGDAKTLCDLQPAIQDMGGSHVNRAVMQGIQGYEQGRDQVVGHHNQVQAHLSRLRRAVPEIAI